MDKETTARLDKMVTRIQSLVRKVLAKVRVRVLNWEIANHLRFGRHHSLAAKRMQSAVRMLLGRMRCVRRAQTYIIKYDPYEVSTHPINTLTSYPINALSTHTITTYYQHTLSSHPINTLYQHILSTHSINTLFYRHTLYQNTQGQHYWFHPSTNITSWDRPKVLQARRKDATGWPLHVYECRCIPLPPIGLEMVAKCSTCKQSHATLTCKQCDDSYCRY